MASRSQLPGSAPGSIAQGTSTSWADGVDLQQAAGEIGLTCPIDPGLLVFCNNLGNSHIACPVRGFLMSCQLLLNNTHTLTHIVHGSIRPASRLDLQAFPVHGKLVFVFLGVSLFPGALSRPSFLSPNPLHHPPRFVCALPPQSLNKEKRPSSSLLSTESVLTTRRPVDKRVQLYLDLPQHCAAVSAAS